MKKKPIYLTLSERTKKAVPVNPELLHPWLYDPDYDDRWQLTEEGKKCLATSHSKLITLECSTPPENHE